MGAGSVHTQFSLSEYTVKDELLRQIEGLQIITRGGNDVSGAMRALQNQALSSGWRHTIQKVALTFTDQRAQNRRNLEEIYQVQRYVSHSS